MNIKYHGNKKNFTNILNNAFKKNVEVEKKAIFDRYVLPYENKNGTYIH